MIYVRVLNRYFFSNRLVPTAMTAHHYILSYQNSPCIQLPIKLSVMAGRFVSLLRKPKFGERLLAKTYHQSWFSFKSRCTCTLAATPKKVFKLVFEWSRQSQGCMYVLRLSPANNYPSEEVLV